VLTPRDLDQTRLSSWPPERLYELVYRRTGWRWPVVLVVLPASLALGLWGFQESAFGQAQLRSIAADLLRREIGLAADVDRLRVGLFPVPRFEARGIDLDDPVYGPFLETDRLEVRPSLTALLTGQLRIADIRIDRPRVRLVLKDGAIRNLPRPPGRRDDGGGLELPFDRLTIDDARVHLDAELGDASLRGVHVQLETRNRRGDRFTLRVGASGGRLSHDRGRETIQQLTAELEHTPEHLDLRRLRLETPHASLAIDDARVRLPDAGALDGHVRATVDLGHLADLPLPLGDDVALPELDGRVTVDLFGELRRADRWRVDGRVEIDGVHVKQFGLGEMVFDISADPEAVVIREGLASVVRRGGFLEIQGRIGLDSGLPTTLSLGVQGLQFEKLMEQLGVTDGALVSWLWNGRIDLSGTLDPLDLRGPGDLDTRDFLVSQNAWHARPRHRVVGVESARLRTRMRLQEAGIFLDDTLVESPKSRLRLDVLLGFDNRLRVTGGTPENAVVDLAELTPLTTIELAGRARIGVDVGGTFRRPALAGTAAIDGFAFGTFPLGDIAGTWEVGEEVQTVRFPSVEAVKRDSRYRADDLFLDFRGGRFLVSAEVQAERLTLEDFFHIFHYEEDERFDDYRGVTAGTLDVAYTKGYPDDGPNGTMVADIDLTLPTAELSGFAFDDGQIRAHWDWFDWPEGTLGGRLTLEHAHFGKGRGTLAVAGTMDRGRLDLTAAADRLALSELEGVGTRVAGLEGLLGLQAEIGGTLGVPRAHVDAQLTAVTYRGEHLGDGRLYVRLTDKEDPWIADAPPADEAMSGGAAAGPCAAGRVGLRDGVWKADPPLRTVDGPLPALERPMAYVVCGSGLGGAVVVDLAIGRTKAYPLRGRLVLDGLPLTPFLPRGAGEASASGEVTGEVLLTDGGMLAPDGLVGTARFDRLRVGQRGIEIRNDGPVRIDLVPGGFELTRVVLVGPSSQLRASGGGTYADGLATTLAGDVDLAVLGTLSPLVLRANGRLGIRVNVDGPMAAPAVFGSAEVAQGSLRVAGVPFPIDDLAGRVSFNARRILIEGFEARVGSGMVAVEGAARLAGRGLDAYRLEVQASDLAYQPLDGVEVGVGAETVLSWEQGRERPRLAGTIFLDRARYRRPIELSQSLSELSRTGRTRVESYRPDQGLVDLDLRVVDRAPIVVANNLIDAEVRIADEEQPFRIVGTESRIGVLGTMVIPRGIVHFRNNDFDVRRGVISFDDRTSISPEFDVEATTEISRTNDFAGVRWLVTLHAFGASDAFQLETRSDPPLSQEDLVLLLTVGMTRAEAQQLQTGDLTGTAALEALAAVSQVDREIQRAVPVIDDFGIASRYSPLTNRTEPQVSIGKRITERVRLSAATGLGQTREVRTSVEWRLSDEASIQALYDNVDTTGTAAFGNVGVDLRWRLEFE